MELRLQKFISSMGTLSDVRNLDPYNPIQVLLEHPVTAMQYTIIVSIVEPSYMGIPINCIWVAMDSTKPFYMKALKLKAIEPSTYEGEAELVANLKQAWIEITTYDEIFSDPQYYDNGSGGGLPGPKGDKGDKGDTGATGPMGPAGPKGDTPVIDINALAAAVAAIIGNGGTPSVKTLNISGPDTIVEGGNASFTVNLVDGGDSTPIVASIAATTGASFVTISGSTVTARAVTQDQTVILSASYVSGGNTLTATKTITIQNAALNSISLTGMPNTIFEGRTQQLGVTAAYSNGTNGAVTSAASYVVEPSSAGSVNASGLFTAAANLSADTPITITATFVEAGVTRTSSVTSTVRNIVVQSLAIAGAAQVNEKQTSQYTATVTRNDGTTSVVTPEWSVDAIGTISAGGLFTAADTASDLTGNINASYTFEGVTVTASRGITVKNVAAVIYPYFGVAAANSVKNAALITSLTGRGPTGARQMNPCSMTSGAGQSYFYAYPVSYGLATFVDLSNGFEGGMDGASGDGGLTLGPITVNVLIDGVNVPFYLYQSDKPNLGLTNWDVR